MKIKQLIEKLQEIDAQCDNSDDLIIYLNEGYISCYLDSIELIDTGFVRFRTGSPVSDSDFKKLNGY